jgi:hypothetical protein
MKNLKTFDEFVNESEFIEFINEGTLAKKGAKELEDINLEDQMDNAEDDEWRGLYQAIADAIGDTPRNVIQVDSETSDDDPLQRKIYSYLSAHHTNSGKAIEPKGFGNSMGWQVSHDTKLNVVRIDDYGFVGFYFSAKSNF